MKIKALAPFLACMLAAGAAQAGEFSVRNCANADIKMKAESFNSTDLVKIVPYQSATISQHFAVTLKCETKDCYLKITHPSEIPSRTAGGAAGLYSSDSMPETSEMSVELPDRQYICIYRRFNANGKITMRSRKLFSWQCGC